MLSLTIGVLIVALALWSLVDGTVEMPVARVWAALTGEGTRVERLVVVDRRLSRVAAAVLIGLALGIAGAISQSITRNPIASPDILGVTAGASAVAVFVATSPGVLTGENGSGLGLLAPAALAGGFVTTGLILALAWRGGFDGPRLVLVGLGVNAIAVAAISWMLTRSTSEEASVAVHWLIGSLEGVRMPEVLALLPVCAGCVVACLALTQSLTALRLGRDTASSLGTRPGRTEALALAVAVLLASLATAVAGPIAFVAFVAPQAALRLFRTAGPPPLAAGLLGALLLLVADTVAQRLPTVLPVGIVTSVVGAPVLLLLLTRYTRRSSV